jgi:proteasomal ATPase-associated factor 1
LTGGADTTLRIWDLEEFYGEPDALIKGHQGAVTCAEFVGRGRNIVSGSRDGTGRLWDVPTQTMIHLYATQTGPVNSVALWKDANAVDSPAEGTIYFSRRIKAQHKPTELLYVCFADSRDFGTEGNLFILGTEEGAVHVFDLRQRDRLFQMTSTGAANAVAVTAATGTIVAGAADGALSGWDIRTLQNGNGNSQPTMSLRRETAAVTALKTVGSSVIACHGDGAAYMWDITTSSSLLDFCGPDYDPLFTIAAGEVGQTATLFTGGRDGILRSYRLPHM